LTCPWAFLISFKVKTYDYNGNFLSGFDAGSGYIGGVETVAESVWIGIEDRVKIYDYDRNLLLDFDAGAGSIGDITLVPEPATLFLLGLGGILIRPRWFK
jgi:hypothetical protein